MNADFPIGTIVSAGVLAGAYPKSHKWDEQRTLWHAARVTEGWPEPLCKTVKREGSVNDDSTQFNLKPVSCPRCLAALKKLGVANPSQEHGDQEQQREVSPIAPLLKAAPTAGGVTPAGVPNYQVRP